MRSSIEGMALNARLHPDRADLLPKMLLGIADDLLRHFVSQRVFSLIVDGDASHRDAPLVWDNPRRHTPGSLCLPGVGQ